MHHSKFAVQNLLLVCVFFALSIAGVAHHELSLDEARVWLSMSETTAGSIIPQTRCEMHCLPWFYGINALTAVTSNPITMQVFSVILGTLCFGLICFFSPFSLLEKLLLGINYYFLFEFNILARPYVLMTLLLVIVSVTWIRRSQSPGAFLISLILLQHTTYFGIFLSVPFIVLTLMELFQRGIPKRDRNLFGGFFVISSLSCLWYLLPLVGNSQCVQLPFGEVNFDGKRVADTLWALARSFFPIVTDTWNEHFFDVNPWGRPVFIGFTCFFFLGALWIFRKERNTLFLFASGLVIIFLYQLTKPIYFGSFFRHLGSLPVFFVVCVWLFRLKHDGKLLRSFFLLFLLAGAYSGTKIFIEDFRREFSNGPAVHRFLSRSENQDREILPDSMLFTSSYLVYSDRAYFNYLTGGEERFFGLGTDRKHPPITGAVVRGIHLVVKLPDEVLLPVIRERAEKAPGKTLVILNYPPTAEFLREANLIPVTEFTGAVNALEDFRIYRPR